MQCFQCQHENPTEANFGNACGTPLPHSYPQCLHKNPPRGRFCNQCGTTLTQQSKPETQQDKPQIVLGSPEPPTSYTPQHLAERILAEQAAMESQ